MSVTTRSSTALGRPSRALVIEVSSTGFFVPKYRGLPEIPLDLAGLRLIEALARGDRPPADGSGEDDRLAEALSERRLLIDDASANEVAAGDHRFGPAPAAPAEHTFEPDTALLLPAPRLLAVGPNGFEIVDHNGALQAQLSSAELAATATFGQPQSLSSALEAYQRVVGADALGEPEFVALVDRLVDARVLVAFDPSAPAVVRETRQAERFRDALRRQAAVNREFDRIEAEHDAERDRTSHMRVIGVHTNFNGPPLSLGLLIATAKAHDGGVLESSFDFRPRLLWDQQRLGASAAAGPAIYLFSNYVWSTKDNLAHSALVKATDPRNITIHGGPDTPRYPEDVTRWFADNPHVDICVHGEGEDAFVDLLLALQPTIGPDGADLNELADVAGISYRSTDGVVTTGSRDRIADLDALTSPILTGMFDGFIPAGRADAGVIIETNRGCPYGCTFCDWGSATLSRIRKFDLDRVFAEIDWCAVHGFGIGIADANFGIFERDVDIAEHIAALKAQHGYPRAVGNNYAKNTVKHLSRIIEIFTEVGIVAEGKMSMQTFDTETLHTIRRKNIKVEKYGELSVEFRRNELPLAVELMMGLPGATLDAFSNDLQACIDRDVRATVFPTVLLPNSPMNDPTYRSENAIVAKPGEYVTSSSSYTFDDYVAMQQIRNAFYVFENFGVLRQVATHIRSRTGQRQIEFYQRLMHDVVAAPERWPMVTVATQVIPQLMVPPVSWKRFLREIHDYLVTEIRIADDSALEVVLNVQHALLPSLGRTFPVHLELKHDYARWHMLVAEQRAMGNTEWSEQVPDLADMPPGTFTVDDPLATCQSAFGYPCDSFLYYESSWDLASPVSRPRQALPDEDTLATAV